MGCCALDMEYHNKGDDGLVHGLVTGHAYSLLAARLIESNGKVLKLLKIRNPHGESEWTGNWSDKSKSWSKYPDVKKELRHTIKDDGSFWMSLHDFLKHFDTFSVVKKSMPLQGCHP